MLDFFMHDFCKMQWKKYISEWIYFSKKERLGIYIMGFLIALLWVLPTFFGGGNELIEPLNISIVQLDSMEKVLIHSQRKHVGKFAKYKSAVHQADTQKQSNARNTHHKYKILDINTADSISLEQLPGIGEKLSARIIKYRERLGGFIEINQLKEIYGMSDSNFIKFSKLIIVQSGFSPSKINLSKATYQEMRRHPYINHLFAKSVLAYVKMHGSINSLEELVRIGSLTEKEIVKVRPYLDVGL